MFEGYAEEEVITEEEATAFCNVNLIGLHSVHKTEKSNSLVMFQVGILDGVLSGALFEVLQPVELLFPTQYCLASQMSRVLEGFSPSSNSNIEASERGDSTSYESSTSGRRLSLKGFLKISEKLCSRLFGSLSQSFLLFLICLSYFPHSHSGQAKACGQKLGMYTFH
jgi:hypothetical protein